MLCSHDWACTDNIHDRKRLVLTVCCSAPTSCDSTETAPCPYDGLSLSPIRPPPSGGSFVLILTHSR
jgi:hypothetical protein